MFCVRMFLSALLVLVGSGVWAQQSGFPCEAGRCEACNQCVNGVCQVLDQEENCGHPCQRCHEGRCEWEPELFINVLLQQKCGPYPCESAICADCEVCVPDAGCVQDFREPRCRSLSQPCVRGQCPHCFDCDLSRGSQGRCVQNFRRIGCSGSPKAGAPTERCGAAVCADCHRCINRNCVPDFVDPACRGRFNLSKVTPLCNGIPCPKCFICVKGQCTRDTTCENTVGGFDGGLTLPTATVRPPTTQLCGVIICPLCYGCHQGICRPIAECTPSGIAGEVIREIGDRIVNPAISGLVNPTLKKIVNPVVRETFTNFTFPGTLGICQETVCAACHVCDQERGRCVRDTESFLCRLEPELQRNLTVLGLCGGSVCGLCEVCESGRCVRDLRSATCQDPVSIFANGCDQTPCPVCTTCVLGRCMQNLLDPDCRVIGDKLLGACRIDAMCPPCFRCEASQSSCVPDFDSGHCGEVPDLCYKGNCPLCYDCTSGFCLRNETQQPGCSSTPFRCVRGRCPFCYNCRDGSCLWDADSCGPKPYPCLETAGLSSCPDCYACAFGYCLPEDQPSRACEGTLTLS